MANGWPITTRRRSPSISRAGTSGSRSMWASVPARDGSGPAISPTATSRSMPTIAVELTTERLRLRPLHPADAPTIAEQVNDWDVVRYTTSIPFPYDRRMAEDFIAGQQKRWAKWSGTHLPEEEVAFAIERNTDRRLVGCIGLQPAEADPDGSAG